jgi:hypothetical protein
MRPLSPAFALALAFAVILVATAGMADLSTARAGDYWDSYVRQYVQRLDGISPDAGDAAAVNSVTHMIDPWPRYAGQRHFNSDGSRMADAVGRYRDVRKLPLAPPPISPVPIGTSGFTGAGGAGGASAAPAAAGAPAQ